MMSPKFHQLIMLLTLTIGACTNSEIIPEEPKVIPEVSINSLVFGYYFGECYGDCAIIYKIENGKLYIDNVDFPFVPIVDENGYYLRDLENISFEKEPLPHEHFEIAQELLESFPKELSILEEQQFGIPDAYDQGGIFLATETLQGKKVWKIDPEDNFQKPEYVVLYRNEIVDVINKIISK